LLSGKNSKVLLDTFAEVNEGNIIEHNIIEEYNNM